jgi:hypothetical protein
MYHIAIPKYNREHLIIQKTLRELDKWNINPTIITVFVVEEEYEKYRIQLPDKYDIVIGLIGLVQQRQFIQHYYNEGDNIVMLDDDIENIDLSISEYTDLDEFFITAFSIIKERGCYIWSVYPVNNIYFRKSKEHITYNLNYCIGAFYGIVNRLNDPDLELKITVDGEKEDVERSLLYFIKDGIITRFNRIGFKTKYYNNTGGLGNFKDRLERSKTNTLLLNDKYGEQGKIKIRKNGMYEFQLKKINNYTVDKEIQQLETVPQEVLNKITELLNNTRFSKKQGRSNRHNFPVHQALIFGMTTSRFTGVRDLSVMTKLNPELWNEIQKVAELINPEFEYKSVHINKNVVCPPHKDGNNVGRSMLISFGDYTGCNLMIEGKMYDAKNTPIIFNGSQLEHWNTDDLEGLKYSLVFY